MEYYLAETTYQQRPSLSFPVVSPDIFKPLFLTVCLVDIIEINWALVQAILSVQCNVTALR